ncbi:MAG: hypothetical protein A2X36_09780 [Elusimicrobia bacterium GWA2_69_24]|nr:MAG: hypothetical protein A2X36_09780 [Elusimicrobia bacterium GWA2_69_24]HBL15542.1 mechanosensitive ion channel protein MscS [Elusimicrobiota bacterium]
MSFAAAASLVFTPAFIGSWAVFLAVLGVLSAAAPASRKPLAAAGLLLLASAVLLAVAALLLRLGVPVGSRAFRLCDAAAFFVMLIGVINAGGVCLFDLFLPRLRIRLSALVRDLILAVAYVCAALAALSSAGANLNGILATSAVMTAVIAFSLQDTLGNVLGGMVLHLEDSFSPGDWVRMGDVEGFVREIRWRQTTLETLFGEVVIVPNSALMKGTVTVIGSRGGRPLLRYREVPFNVYYDSGPDAVIAAVQAALREDPPPGVAAEPPLDCVTAEFQETHAVYKFRYWLSDLRAPGGVDAAVRLRIYYALSRVGIKLSIPTRSLVVVQKDEDVRERSRKHEAERRAAAIRGVDIFQALQDDEVRTLAERLAASPFSGGECITRQGAPGDWLYILFQGEAEVRIYNESRSSYQTVSTLRPGDFLGEMGLMTGEPRTATVVALSEVGCYRLDRDGFRDVVARRPELAEAISLVLARRRVELESARTGLSAEVRKQRLETEQGDLLSVIRGIFSLR